MQSLLLQNNNTVLNSRRQVSVETLSYCFYGV